MANRTPYRANRRHFGAIQWTEADNHPNNSSHSRAIRCLRIFEKSNDNLIYELDKQLSRRKKEEIFIYDDSNRPAEERQQQIVNRPIILYV